MRNMFQYQHIKQDFGFKYSTFVLSLNHTQPLVATGHSWLLLVGWEGPAVNSDPCDF